MNLKKTATRFLIPSFVVTAYYWFKYRAKVSTRAEVDLTPQLRLGPGCEVSSFCKIKALDGPVIIGKDVTIGTCCFVSAGSAGITIGDDSMIAANVSIVARNYRYEELEVPIRLQEHTSQGIRIGSNVWIGVGAVILDGAEIGDGAIVTPNTVVTRQVEKNAIVQGHPAEVIFIRR